MGVRSLWTPSPEVREAGTSCSNEFTSPIADTDVRMMCALTSGLGNGKKLLPRMNKSTVKLEPSKLMHK